MWMSDELSTQMVGNNEEITRKITEKKELFEH